MNAPRLDRIGPYRIESRLGTGGMGEVYRAYDERLDRWVAIKLIRPDVAGHEKARERFRREARAAACLNHPAIVQIHDILQSDAGDAIVMEVVEGPTLADRLVGGPLELGCALRLALRIAEGLAAAHAEGIVHRDLKTENVVITPAGDAKILDFGVAKRFRQTDADGSLSLDGALVGTLKAMSPEQARGWRVDHRSDIFSFGTLLYEMLTGRPPFSGDGALDILTKICTWQPPPVRELNSEVPVPLSDLIDHLLEKDRTRRPQSAQEAVTALEKILGARTGSQIGSAAPTISNGGPTLVDVPRRAAYLRSLLPSAEPQLWKRSAVRLWKPASVVVGGILLVVGFLNFPNERKPQLNRPSGLQVLRGSSDRLSELCEQEFRRNPSLRQFHEQALREPSDERLGKSVKEEIDAGEPTLALCTIDGFLNRHPNNDHFARAKEAEIELWYGSPRTAVRIYEGLGELKLAELTNLGMAHLLSGRRDQAVRAFRKAIREFPRDENLPSVMLNLADALSLSGDIGSSNDMYKKVVQLIDWSKDTKDPKHWTVRAQALAHVGRRELASKSARKALALRGAKSDPQVRYELSLVYTLTKDFELAFENANEALEKRAAPGWFDFSWFDDLRTEKPELDRLLLKHGGRSAHSMAVDLSSAAEAVD